MLRSVSIKLLNLLYNVRLVLHWHPSSYRTIIVLVHAGASVRHTHFWTGAFLSAKKGFVALAGWCEGSSGVESSVRSP